MGVTLERVQNKFACIIGELCSEPVILSQFAIWVDLRIAEYKAKGAISLDCSGCDPDPAWLKGHVTHHRKPKAREKTLSLSHLPQESDVPFLSSSSSHEMCDRLSPDIVVVKEEIGPEHERHSDIFSSRFQRKRNILSEGGGEHSHDSFQSHSKMPRLEHAAESPPLVFEPVNESLMSIIGNSGQEGDRVTTEADHTDTIPQVDSLYMNKYNTAATSNNSVAVNLESQEAFSSSRGESDPMVDRGACYRNIVTQSHNRTANMVSLRSRILNRDQKASSTVRNMVAAVASFERWLSASHPEETRCVEYIPPAELDPYLTDFFLNVKQPSGQDYKVVSFRQIRYNLDKFLQDHRYPYSLTDSSEFLGTRLAFQKRLIELGNVEDLRQHGTPLASTSVTSSTFDRDATPLEKTTDSNSEN